MREEDFDTLEEFNKAMEIQSEYFEIIFQQALKNDDLIQCFGWYSDINTLFTIIRRHHSKKKYKFLIEQLYEGGPPTHSLNLYLIPI